MEIVDTVDSKQSLGRPGNPTPAEATTNGDSGLGIHRDAQSRTRPYNPTPLHALKTSSVMLSNSAHESVNGMPAVAEDPTQYEGEAATQYGMAGDDTVSPVGYPYHSTAPADDNNGIHGNIDTGDHFMNFLMITQSPKGKSLLKSLTLSSNTKKYRKYIEKSDRSKSFSKLQKFERKSKKIR